MSFWKHLKVREAIWKFRSEKVCKTMPENCVSFGVPFWLRSLVPFEKCVFDTPWHWNALLKAPQVLLIRRCQIKLICISMNNLNKYSAKAGLLQNLLFAYYADFHYPMLNIPNLDFQASFLDPEWHCRWVWCMAWVDRPVVWAFAHTALYSLAQHDNGPRVLLPDRCGPDNF